MLLTVIQDPREAAFLGAGFSFILGLFLLILGLVFYYPYIKDKFRYEYGAKKSNFFEYMEDAFKILSYHRTLGLIFFGVILIIISLVFFVIGMIK